MKHWIIFIAIIVIALAGVFGVAYVSKQDAPEHKEGYEEEHTGPGYTLEEIPIEDLKDSIPDLSREVQFSGNLSVEAQNLIKEKTAEAQGRLTEDPTRGDDWLELGVLFHSAGDFEGARLVWEFLADIDKTNVVAYDNLAKLYHFSLRDFPKAESYFKQSIAINGASLTPYLGLYELYRYSYKTNTTLAEDTLKEAIEKFPDVIEIHLTLGAYYRDIGRKTDARATLLEGMDKARDANNVDLMSAFGVELERVQ